MTTLRTPSSPTHAATALDHLLWPLHAHHTRLGHDLHGQRAAPSTAQLTPEAPLVRHVRRLQDVVQSGIPRSCATHDDAEAARRSLDAVLDIAWTPPAVTTRTVPPPQWWLHATLGQLCAAAVRWLYDDDLINYTEAAALLYPDEQLAGREAQRRLTQRIARLVADGVLVPFVDKAEPNPKHAQRVVRGQVVALRQAWHDVPNRDSGKN